MEVTIIIQARMGSTRLPGKVLQKIGDKTIIEHVIDRCKQLTDKVVVALSNAGKDFEVVEMLGKFLGKVGIFLSYDVKEEDLLKRYLMCGIAYDCDYILRVPADCPFFSLSAAEELIKKSTELLKWEEVGALVQGDYDYIAHYLEGEEYPTIWKHSTGQYLEVVRLSALFDVYNRIVRQEIKENEIRYVYGWLATIDCYKQHPTSGIYLEPERYNIKRIEIKKIPDHQLAINTADDLARVQKLYEEGKIK